MPSNDYDRAIIMGVFHNIDIQFPNTSPNKQIKYEVTGTAPHRKWVLSFYKVPCYLNACWNKINNTYQVTLYEGLGLVEVHVWEREVCTAWNNGNAMIGMQNYDRDKGIMAPGRSAFTTPRWGGLNMNETWRFAPNDGEPLLKKVELYTTTGEFVAPGDTVNDSNGNYNVSFYNVCPVTGRDTYLIKSTYKKIDDLAAEVYGVDTFVVYRMASPAVPSLHIQQACPGNANGKITIDNPVGPAYSYSINNATFQASPVFNDLPAGAYVITVMDNTGGCAYDTAVQVNNVYTINTHINYPRLVYCNGESLTPGPVIDGITGGTFTANTPGLDINTNTGTINTATSDTGNYTVSYHISSNDSCVNPVATVNVRIVNNTQFVWTGAVNSSWENAGNWSCNNFPTNTSNVVIYSGTIIIHSNVTVNKLTIMPGANLTVSPGFNLTILNP